jgi:hypothetical protein
MYKMARERTYGSFKVVKETRTSDFLTRFLAIERGGL